MKLMIGAILKQNIIFLWIEWQFFDVPRGILRAWKNFLLFYLDYFSIPLLFKTLFSPWRRYKWHYPRGLIIGKYFEVFISNLISRTIGAVMRIILIFIGILVEIFIIFAGAAVFFGWLILPFLLIGGIFYGFKILF